nr:hypothetical protein DM860_011449 [Ipomoea trifida]
MATTIMNMSGTPLPYPSHGRMRIRTITRATMPGSSVGSFTLGDNWFEIHFNPLFHLSSREATFSFFFGRLATLGVDIVYPIAMFAFDLVRSRNWFYGVSLSVDLETVYVLEEERMRSADFLDGEMILNDDTAAVSEYYEQLDDFLFDLMLQPFGHGNVGMSEQEISMLRTERLSDDDEDGECFTMLALPNGCATTQHVQFVAADVLHPPLGSVFVGFPKLFAVIVALHLWQLFKEIFLKRICCNKAGWQQVDDAGTIIAGNQ